MALTVIPVLSSVQLEVQTGTDAAGNPAYANRTYNRVRPTALDQDVFEVAQALASLMSQPLHEVRRVINNALVETV